MSREVMVKVYKFDDEDMTPELRALILEKHAYDLVDDCWWDMFDFNYEFEKCGMDRGGKMFFDLDRGSYIQFPELTIEDGKKFIEWTGMSVDDYKNTRITFSSNRDFDTQIELTPDSDWEEDEDPQRKNADLQERLDQLDIEGKFRDLVQGMWLSLRDHYEYLCSEEALIDFYTDCDYEFFDDGEISPWDYGKEKEAVA